MSASASKADEPLGVPSLPACRISATAISYSAGRVWKLYRFGRSPQGLIGLVGDPKERGVEVVSLRESIDTTTPGG
jgi:resolvase-like protein